MNHELDLANLSLCDALDFAILIKEEAQRRYGALVDQLELHDTPEAASFFRRLLNKEIKLVDHLRERRKEAFGDEPITVKLAMVPDVEARVYESVRAFMTEHAALRIALASETRAAMFYRRALELVTDDAVRDLFNELLQGELQHRKMVRDYLDELPPEDTTNPEHFVDEPTAH